MPTTDFGLSTAERMARRVPEADEPSELVAEVVSTRLLHPGYWRFEMADGTIWDMIEMRRTYRAPQPGDRVRIRRGALGAFLLNAGRQPVVRVRRIN